MTADIITFNAGSSSVRFAVFGTAPDAKPWRVMSGRAPLRDGSYLLEVADDTGLPIDLGQHEYLSIDALVAGIFDLVEEGLGNINIVATGHRVIHGGQRHTAPSLIAGDVLAGLEQLSPIAPMDQARTLAPIHEIARRFPTLPQIACFDTVFHQSRPLVAKRFALPTSFEDAGIIRYCFHGLSYESIAQNLAENAPEILAGRVVFAHLGSTASLCAMRDGLSIDTSMAFSALDGIPMATRPGALDPGVVLYLLEHMGMGVKDVQDLLYHRSGLLGVSGISEDVQVLLKSRQPPAAAAIELFCYRIAREIGALSASLGGLDALVFTAGIGENQPEIRRMICERCAWLGVRLNAAANAASDPSISSGASLVPVLVIPTDEELAIAGHTSAVLAAAS
ncbi:MAG: ackA [Hyphomicrobiales bacterium]|nr:ackA [Hyphomicrobiales bacterium]